MMSEIVFKDDDDSGLVWLENDEWPEETQFSGLILRDIVGKVAVPEFLHFWAENGSAQYRITDYDHATDTYDAVLLEGRIDDQA